MNSTYDEWFERNKSEAPKDQVDIRLAIRAAVHAENLTSNEIWNQFLGYLQGGLEECRKRLETYRDRLLSPYVVDQQEILLIKIAIADLEGQTKAVEWIIELPKSILETGEIARKLFSSDDLDNPSI